MEVRGIESFAEGQEISEHDLKTAAFYLSLIEVIGSETYRNMPKLLRIQLTGYLRHPEEKSLHHLSDQLAEMTLNPSENELATLKLGGSSIANKLHPSMSMALIHCRAIDEIKKNTVGFKTSTAPINTLMGVFESEAMWRSANITEEDLNLVYLVALAAAKQDEQPGIHWYIPKLMQLVQPLANKQMFESFLPTVKTNEALYSLEELEAANDELFASMRSLQKYGVKPCVAPALPQSTAKEWLVRGPISDDRKTIYPPFHPARNIIGTFHGSRNPIKSSEAQLVKYDSGGIASVNMVAIPGLTGRDEVVRGDLGSDGHLYDTLGGQKMIDYLSADASLGFAYEQIRSEIISIYYDAVVPVYITERLKNEIAPRNKVLGKLAIGLKKVPDFKRLALARQRLLEGNLTEILGELESPDKDMVEPGDRRPLAKHDVVNHIRRLRPGWKASPEARERCLAETGIELAEYGETYVKKYTKGELEAKTRSHKVSFAIGKIATKRKSQNI